MNELAAKLHRQERASRSVHFRVSFPKRMQTRAQGAFFSISRSVYLPGRYNEVESICIRNASGDSFLLWIRILDLLAVLWGAFEEPHCGSVMLRVAAGCSVACFLCAYVEPRGDLAQCSVSKGMR